MAGHSLQKTCLMYNKLIIICLGFSPTSDIKLLTSFDGGDIHQESWSWVGSRGTAVSRTEGRQSRRPGKTHREIYLPPLGNLAICVCVAVWLCDICDMMQQGAYAD